MGIKIHLFSNYNNKSSKKKNIFVRLFNILLKIIGKVIEKLIVYILIILILLFILYIYNRDLFIFLFGI